MVKARPKVMVLGRVLNAAIGLTPDGPHLSHLALGRVLNAA